MRTSENRTTEICRSQGPSVKTYEIKTYEIKSYEILELKYYGPIVSG